MQVWIKEVIQDIGTYLTCDQTNFEFLVPHIVPQALTGVIPQHRIVSEHSQMWQNKNSDYYKIKAITLTKVFFIIFYKL